MEEEEFGEMLKKVLESDNYDSFKSGYKGKVDRESESTIRNFFERSKKKSTTSGGGIMDTVIKGTGGALDSLIKAGSIPDSYNTAKFGFKELKGLMFDSNNQLKSFSEMGIGLLKTFTEPMIDYYSNQNKLLNDINTKTGLTGELSKNFREQITLASPRLAQIGISFGDIADSMINLVQDSGKFNLVNRETLTQAGEIGTAYVGSLRDVTESYKSFEKVGIGAVTANKSLEMAGKRSLELGLSSQKITKEMIGNLDKMNLYGFQNGVKGLERMVQKSNEFRFSMSETFKVADKVWDPEGALDLAANLQVLGGAFGDLNDPIKMMYMATNNVEGLQDAIIGASANLATFNEDTGSFQVMGINLRRAREEAKVLGISVDELSSAAIAAQERMSASSMLSGLNITDENKEFLTNLARMKDGKMTIDLQSEEMKKEFGTSSLALENLSKVQAEKLLKYQTEFKELSPNDLIRKQVNSMENIQRDTDYIVKLLTVKAGPGIEAAVLKMINAEKMVKESQNITAKAEPFIEKQVEMVKKLLPGDNDKSNKKAQNKPEKENKIVFTVVNQSTGNAVNVVSNEEPKSRVGYDQNKSFTVIV